MGCKDCCRKPIQTFLSVWNAPAGPKTIFFWAPLVKWGLVLANVADIVRPAKDLSLFQNLALTFTGLIWARYSTVIIPINWLLFSVNLFVGLTSLAQTGRAVHYMITSGGDETTANITTIITNLTSVISSSTTTPEP